MVVDIPFMSSVNPAIPDFCSLSSSFAAIGSSVQSFRFPANQGRDVFMRPKLLLVFAISAAFMPASLAHAQDADSATIFLKSAYQQYGNQGRGIDFTGPHASLYFHSSLLALIHADQKAVDQDIPICCDADPLCDCQDWDGIWDLKIQVQMESPKRAEATVSFAMSAPKGRAKDDLRRLRITLVPEGGQWRIYDILDQSGPDASSGLRAQIQKEIAYYARHPDR
jgi:hypothetical protein